MDLSFNHVPVMLGECLEGLNIKPDGVYVDCTVGGGGHSYEIASRLEAGKGKLICFDRDEDALAAAGKRLEKFGDTVTFVHSNFNRIGDILDGVKIDGALIDLGVSSYQLDTAERGFSYMADAPLDMRMDRGQQLSAYDVINNYTDAELVKILYDYGEEKYAPKIVSAISKARPVETTGQLVDIIKKAVPKTFDRGGGHHPAKRTFQAVRIEVNGELAVIEPTLRSIIRLLSPGGRLCVITFHSLEDRIVKQVFASEVNPCECPPEIPVCVCGKKPRVKSVTKKPLPPSEEEMKYNSRSKSAKLRIVEKL